MKKKMKANVKKKKNEENPKVREKEWMNGKRKEARSEKERIG